MSHSTPVPLKLAGRYELLRTQATDANTASLLAWDTRLKAWRSIRVARPGDDAASRRMLAVAQWAAKLEHPALERVIDVGTDGTVVFVVRDRLLGSVSDHIRRRGAVPPEWALNVVTRCAEGLTWAHPRGIVHGHPRPDVVQFSEDGSAVLTSFGQRAVLRDTPETRAGADWAHLAPELRQAWQPDAATDVYALGALLYMMVSGKPSADLFYAEAYEGLLSAIPRSLRPLLHRACAFAPTERFTTEALYTALRKAQADFPPARPPAPWLESTQDFPDRNQYDGMDAILTEIAPHLDTPQPEPSFSHDDGSSRDALEPPVRGSAPVRAPMPDARGVPTVGSSLEGALLLDDETVPPGTELPSQPSLPTPASPPSGRALPPHHSSPRSGRLPALPPHHSSPRSGPTGRTPVSAPSYIAPSTPPSPPPVAHGYEQPQAPSLPLPSYVRSDNTFPSGGESYLRPGYLDTSPSDAFARRNPVPAVESVAPQVIRTSHTAPQGPVATGGQVLRVIVGATLFGVFLTVVGFALFWFVSTEPQRADRSFVSAVEAETAIIGRVMTNDDELQRKWESFELAKGAQRAPIAADIVSTLEDRVEAAPMDRQIEEVVRRLARERDDWQRRTD